MTDLPTQTTVPQVTGAILEVWHDECQKMNSWGVWGDDYEAIARKINNLFKHQIADQQKVIGVLELIATGHSVLSPAKLARDALADYRTPSHDI